MHPSTLDDTQLGEATQAAILENNQPLIDRLADECDRRDRYTPTPPDPTATLHQAALWYASIGLAVFPLHPGTKLPMAGSNGFKDATINSTQINQWWTRTPNANIGIATGLVCDVADLDGWDGIDAWAQLEDAPTPLGVVITPRPCGGGRHIWLPVTGRHNGVALMPGVDWRGQGGYVVAPPSITPDGRYRWHRPLDTRALGGAA